jgi:peptidoglycan/xylan/chitin deacetylase (PgdA/CDA1 family)
MRAVLTFHGVDETRSVLSIAPRELASLVQSIRRADHAIVPLARLLADPELERSVALTFDDGFTSVPEHALPVLRDLGAPATLFLTTGYVGRDNQWPTQPAGGPRFDMMSWSQVERLHASGWAVESHTVTHPDLRELDGEELERELSDPIDEIERRLGRRPAILAYPYGYYDAKVLTAARRFYRHGITAKMGRIDDAATDPYRVPRLDTFYLRGNRVHRRFGRPGFAAYMAFRGLARRAKKHPAEMVP